MNAIPLMVLLAVGGQLGPGPRVGLGTKAGGKASPVVSSVDFNAFGSSSYGPGIPAPTIDCVATGENFLGANCTTATKFGNPTAGTSPFYWNGFSGAQQGSVVLDGTGDYYNLGDVGAQTVNGGDHTWCAIIKPTLGATRTVFGRRSAGINGVSLQVNSGGAFVYFVPKSGGSTQVTATTSATGGAWSVACGSYDYISDGGSRMLINNSGTAETLSTTAVGPLIDNATNMQVGILGTYNDTFVGGIARLSIWTGTALSATQLALAVASQMGLVAAKPAGTVLTHARTDATLCCPVSDSECFWLAPGVPCVRSAGVEVYGAASNLIVYSSQFEQYNAAGSGAWAYSITPTANAAVAPDGTTTADSLVTVGTAHYLFQNATVAANQTATNSVWVRANQNCDFNIGMTNGATWNGATACGFTATTAWQRFSCSGIPAAAQTTDGFVIGSIGSGTGQNLTNPKTLGTCTFYLWGGQVTQTALPMPYRATTTLAYSGVAGTATTLSMPVALTNPNSLAFGLTATLANWSLAGSWPALLSLGTGDSANSMSLYANAGSITSYVYTGATARSGYYTHALAAGSRHTLVNATGADVPIFEDRVPKTLTLSGSGAGAPASVGATLYIGHANGATGTTQMSGAVERVVQCRKTGGCK